VILADEDDEGNISSLHTAIKEAKVELVYHDNVVGTAPILEEHYIPPEEGEAVGDFRPFFIHFPLQKELKVKFSVELLDGRTAEALRSVNKQRDPDHEVHLENPAIRGRPKLNWPYTDTLDYNRNP
jgi:hypothetical protein